MKKARLAYLLKKFPRTSETFILNEMLAQEGQGETLHVFSRRKPDDEPRHPQLADLRATVEVLPPSYKIDPWKTLFSSFARPADLFGRVESVVAAANSWNHPRFPVLLAEALHLLRRTTELGIDHIHTHFATDSAVVAMLLHDLGGPTYSITAHAKDIYRDTVDPVVLDRMFARSKFAITVCDANVDYLSRRLGPEAISRVRRLYNGIDLEDFRPPARGRDENHILGVGRLVEKKGFHVLIEALSRLRSRGRDCRVTIVGEGDERERLEELIRTLELEDRVQMLGALDLGEVRRLMSSATVICQPCLVGADGNRDALPTVLVEALACGLPAISTPVTGIPEILDGGRAGIIVPEKAPAALAAALQDLLEDTGRREWFARVGRERAETLFDRDKISAELNSWFQEAMQSSRETCASPA
jgi:colanic acid/amylovoran biosynthesis glycosyltransferase